MTLTPREALRQNRFIRHPMDRDWDEETKKALDASIADIKAGRIRPLEEIQTELGL